MQKSKLKKRLTKSLQKNGWRIKSNHFLGHRFDIVAERPLTPWYVLISFSKSNHKKTFEDISNKSKGFLWGYGFLYCVVAEDISKIGRDSFSVLRNKGGGGNTLILDLKKQKVDADIPLLLLDARFYTKQMKRVLEGFV